ncbi:uncharacterized protein B0P05DRAFT_35575 [Gilbertella persicaria]|uniref:uncharacterized protein n=1 Tax=Gilbertella persicaria TaxID=101096 RepID=UPI00221F7D91|nr:uncharacterized protein B0P05DRAFT_35575 [Gilbertella persicaria]KAI8084341.1 hypothetical protein B0P05DRAFT_35575 [Gilbertella persicaria]
MTNRPGEYILKVHGLGLTNVIMQVESEKDLNKWNDWFNGSLSYTTQAEECFLKQVHPKSIKDMDAAAATTTTTKFRLDSGITTQQVEDDYGEEDDDDDQTRRGSEMTVATFHCGYLSPKDVPLPAQQLEETDMSTADQGNSFYSSFAEYLSSVPSENSTVVATTPSP